MTRRRGGGPPPEDERAVRIAGMVARVVAMAVHDAILTDGLLQTRSGQETVADALLGFARHLSEHHFRGVEHLIDASTMARHASDLLRGGGI